MPRPPRASHGFTLIELIIVVSIIAILIGMLLPAIAGFQRSSRKTACGANLRQVGLAIQSYSEDFAQVLPRARYMAEPFISGDTDPPLTTALSPYFDNPSGFRCPGDNVVFPLSGISYEYMSLVSGLRVAEIEQRFRINASQVVLARDFDGYTFDTTAGPVDVPPFHDLRNLLFADGHAGNFNQ